MDVTLVVFYNKGSSEVAEFEPIISKAACSTKRARHAYAGVDCTVNNHLCQLNNATKLPLVRIYAKTSCLGQMETLRSLSPEVLRQYVEMAPGVDTAQMLYCPRVEKDANN
ncbi:hypothetical protein BsWGS_17022 [Bradybaena similaris]